MDYHQKLVDQALLTMDTYLGQFLDIKVKGPLADLPTCRSLASRRDLERGQGPGRAAQARRRPPWRQEAPDLVFYPPELLPLLPVCRPHSPDLGLPVPLGLRAVGGGPMARTHVCVCVCVAA